MTQQIEKVLHKNIALWAQDRPDVEKDSGHGKVLFYGRDRLLTAQVKGKVYIFLDETHSIGVLGPNCRVDHLMFTFPKSFGATGRYTAGGKILTELPRPRFRLHEQEEFRLLLGAQIILQHESENTKHWFIVYGSDECPVVILTVYYPTTIGTFSREMLSRNIAVVAVGAPATPML
ncbi:hypothetical protein BJ742DRAFT_865611 [Cladochytrium replicatum]|nr:hypothetical protein BJ742DRAFT_865611 [Cladochytrium replicatum]